MGQIVIQLLFSPVVRCSDLTVARLSRGMSTAGVEGAVETPNFPSRGIQEPVLVLASGVIAAARNRPPVLFRQLTWAGTLSSYSSSLTDYELARATIVLNL